MREQILKMLMYEKLPTYVIGNKLRLLGFPINTARTLKTMKKLEQQKLVSRCLHQSRSNEIVWKLTV